MSKVSVEINIGYSDVHDTKFDTEYSILDKNKRVYKNLKSNNSKL